MTTPAISVPLFGIGVTEWLIIGVIIALLFGSSKIPKLGKGLGEGLRNFKKGITGELEEPKPGESETTQKETSSSDKDA